MRQFANAKSIVCLMAGITLAALLLMPQTGWIVMRHLRLQSEWVRVKRS